MQARERLLLHLKTLRHFSEDSAALTSLGRASLELSGEEWVRTLTNSLEQTSVLWEEMLALQRILRLPSSKPH